jgi:predicted TIM-barrel fold metal-dependent hydrolase
VEYRTIDADSHVNEPAEVWQSRVPAAMRQLAPRMITSDNGRIGWSFEGGKRLHRVTSACAGFDETTYTADGARWDEIRPGSYDPKARLAEMELDMIQAQVLYPSLAPQPQFFGTDPELQVACVRAYNDWIHEFSSVAPERLIGLPIAPETGVDDVVAEWKRIAARGDRGFVISGHPSGGDMPSEADDRFWSEVEDWDYAIHIHFGFASGVKLTSNRGVGYLTSAALIDMGVAMYRPLADLIYSGVFQRFPKLKVVAVEAGIGWIPYFCHHLDDNFLRRRFRADVQLARMPSEYFKDQVWATFIEDPYGIKNRHEIGVDRIMWSTDYPHTNSNWPNSQRIAAYEFRDVPEAERRLIMRDNAAGIYGLSRSMGSPSS